MLLDNPDILEKLKTTGMPGREPWNLQSLELLGDALVEFCLNSDCVHVSEFAVFLGKRGSWLQYLKASHKEIRDAVRDGNEVIGARLYKRSLKKEYDGRLFSRMAKYHFKDLSDFEEDYLTFKARLGNILQAESGQKADTLLAKIDLLSELMDEE